MMETKRTNLETFRWGEKESLLEPKGSISSPEGTKKKKKGLKLRPQEL